MVRLIVFIVKHLEWCHGAYWNKRIIKVMDWVSLSSPSSLHLLVRNYAIPSVKFLQLLTKYPWSDVPVPSTSISQAPSVLSPIVSGPRSLYDMLLCIHSSIIHWALLWVRQQTGYVKVNKKSCCPHRLHSLVEQKDKKWKFHWSVSSALMWTNLQVWEAVVPWAHRVKPLHQTWKGVETREGAKFWSIHKNSLPCLFSSATKRGEGLCKQRKKTCCADPELWERHGKFGETLGCHQEMMSSAARVGARHPLPVKGQSWQDKSSELDSAG